jgi:hypothetical protein
MCSAWSNESRIVRIRAASEINWSVQDPASMGSRGGRELPSPFLPSDLSFLPFSLPAFLPCQIQASASVIIALCE